MSTDRHTDRSLLTAIFVHPGSRINTPKICSVSFRLHVAPILSLLRAIIEDIPNNNLSRSRSSATFSSRCQLEEGEEAVCLAGSVRRDVNDQSG